jgi:hypothetical protein
MAGEKAVLFIGSDRAHLGREQDAMKHWAETGPWLDVQQKAGWFSRWDGFWLTAHGGDLNGAFVCFGDRAKLDEWRRTDEFEAWVFRTTQVVSNLGVIPGVNFAAAKETMARMSKFVGK